MPAARDMLFGMRLKASRSIHWKKYLTSKAAMSTTPSRRSRMSTQGAQCSACEIGRAAQIAVAEMQRLLRLDAFETGRDQVGRLLRRHHAHIDFAAEDRRVELHVRAAFVGHGAQFGVDDFGDLRHLRAQHVELVAAGDDHLIGRHHRGLVHAARQLGFAPVRFEIAEPIGSRDLADHLGVGHVVVIDEILGLRLVDFEPGHAPMQMLDEIIGVIFAAGPFVETDVTLLLDCLRRRAIENLLAFLRRAFAGVMAGQILLHVRMQPPGADDRGTNGHSNSSHVASLICDVV